MKISLTWLKEYVDIKISPEELADRLTMSTAEVEEVKYLGKGLDNVVVGEILSIKQHPNADRLKVAKVRIGGGEDLQIVCGAPNIEEGQKVPVALVGAVLPSSAEASEGRPGFEIKESMIRGVKSAGMMCAEDELGLGDDHTGILILDPSAEIGVDIRRVLGLDDIVLEIDNKSITHRADLFSHIGIAREVAAITGGELKIKSPELGRSEAETHALDVEVEDDKACPRYMACVMDKVEVKESPEWMKARLRAVGVRPISNIVDITNYILLEYGQPLHAFDARSLKSPVIRARKAEKGEKILALDGKEYELSESNLVIADDKDPVAVAGVMGGENTGISDATETIVIESANFDSACVRRTAWSLGLHSESSLRFEKGLYVGLSEKGMARAIELVGDLAGGKLVSKVYDEKSAEAEAVMAEKGKVSLDMDRVRKAMGVEIDDSKAVEILESLQFEVKEVSGQLEVFVPFFRTDVGIEEDLVEEIARIYGYDNIKPSPVAWELLPVKLPKEARMQRKLRQAMAGAGFDEVYSYSFCGEKQIEEGGLSALDHDYELSSPMNPEQKYLKVSLLPRLCRMAEKNSDNFELARIFEIGHVYPAEGERAFLAGAAINKKKSRYGEGIERSAVKGVLELALETIRIDLSKVSYRQSERKPSFPGFKTKVLDVLISGEKMGIAEVLDCNNIEKKLPLAECFEIDLEKAMAHGREKAQYRSIIPYPAIERDFSVIVDKSVKYGDIAALAADIDSLVERVEYASVFESEALGEGKKSLAFRVVLRSPERTLASEEADKISEKIFGGLKEKFGAEMRS